MGLAIGIMWTIYIIVALILLTIFRKFIERKLYRNIFLAFLILLPTWDVLIQKTIKTYFEIFEMEPIIYSYPERDENNKIESLGLVDVNTIFFNNFEKLYEEFITKPANLFSLDIQKNISNFIEIDAFEIYSKQRFPIRITFNNDKYSVEKIILQEARYEIQKIDVESKLFKFYKKQKFLLVDRKNKNILAEAVAFNFPTNEWYSWFRNYVVFRLLFTSKDKTFGKGGHSVLWIKGMDNIDLMIYKSLNINTYISKGFKDE